MRRFSRILAASLVVLGGSSVIHAASTQNHRQDLSAIQKFFETEVPPKDLYVNDSIIEAFVEKQIEAGYKIALVTSGGTMVPLEKRTVRFIDNFSTGTRGSVLAENLLEEGYSVIYLYRRGTRRPFISHVHDFINNAYLGKSDSSHMPTSRSPWALSVITALENVFPELKTQSVPPSSLELTTTLLSSSLRGMHFHQSERVLEVPFATVSDYLFYLKQISEKLNKSAENSIILLAAAVSDFYVPANKMEEHKIQSDSQQHGLTIQLDPVPKALYALKHVWSPRSCVVSFKLETDPNLLLPKAVKALANYGIEGVLANQLERRYDEVFLVKSPHAARKCCENPVCASNKFSVLSVDCSSNEASECIIAVPTSTPSNQQSVDIIKDKEQGPTTLPLTSKTPVSFQAALRTIPSSLALALNSDAPNCVNLHERLFKHTTLIDDLMYFPSDSKESVLSHMNEAVTDTNREVPKSSEKFFKGTEPQGIFVSRMKVLPPYKTQGAIEEAIAAEVINLHNDYISRSSTDNLKNRF